MGKTNQYSCVCGYKAQLDVGGGVSANQEFSVRRMFSDAELSAFDKVKENGTLTRFFWESMPAHCPKCQELVAVPVLHYWVGMQEFSIQKSCPSCGGALALQKTPIICPKCGKGLDEAQAGLWD